VKIYYAHSKLIYDTPREKQELKWLKKKFIVVDPNKDLSELGSMEPYIKKMFECNMVICSEYKKHVGKGVYEEVYHAITNGVKAKVLRKFLGRFVLKEVTGLQIIDGTDWKVGYAKVGTLYGRK